ncbi:helix-turn-helix domain-containing protein [Streptomyces sp. NPDC101181]|uniref:helix-turn-helix domain-containing protein n=1 Tax=Streptomyces sp. NPDC101181 TaxID=3366125 RepID=UPI003827029F
MGRPLRKLTPYVSAQHRFGAELRRLRKQQGMSQKQLGLLIMHSGSTVSKVEKAERWPSREFADRSDHVLGAKGALTDLWLRAQEERNADVLAPGARRRRAEAEGVCGRGGASGLTVLDEVLILSDSDRQRRYDLRRLVERIAADLRHLRAIVTEQQDAARLSRRVDQAIGLLSDGMEQPPGNTASDGGPRPGAPADRAPSSRRWKTARSHGHPRAVLDKGRDH